MYPAERESFSAANLPRLVSMVSRRTPEGNCSALGVLTGGQPTQGYSAYALPSLDDSWKSAGKRLA